MFGQVGKSLRKPQEMKELATDRQDNPKTHYTTIPSHQQREPDLDVLAPITTEDYAPVSSQSCKVIQRSHALLLTKSNSFSHTESCDNV